MRLHPGYERSGLDLRNPAVVTSPRQPRAAFSWREVDAGHLVLEGRMVPSAVFARAVELHLFIDPFDGATVAWWETDGGSWLRLAHVGKS
jgi:hypothetical protein